jgi:acyl-coenzyme A synthetase/AMP-(fatty) acid ligase
VPERIVVNDWVEDFLLAGPPADVCLWLDRPLTREELRSRVGDRVRELAGTGLRPGGSISLRLPPSLAFVVDLLAAWRLGAQVSLLDHRLTDHEVDRALADLAPQYVVSTVDRRNRTLRGYADVTPVTRTYPGRPAPTEHALLQLSSGSTGPSKVIGRSAADLMTEVERYAMIDGTPREGERVLLLASMVHVLGLVGGLLYGLHAGVQLALPWQHTADSILDAVAAGPEPTTVIGVPFHVRLLSTVARPPRVPQLTRVTVGGELIPPALRRSFADRYPVPLGNMYGMTEVGVIATDLFGEHDPALRPAPGMTVREVAGQLLVATAASPYVGRTEPGRWADGWLSTKDAGTVDRSTGLMTVRGRLDSQVSVGGLKVDLTEVEQTLAGLPGVTEAVVICHDVIEAFVALDGPATRAELTGALADRLAAYKRPRRVTVLDNLPRTATGKLVRSPQGLRAATSAHRSAAREES